MDAVVMAGEVVVVDAEDAVDAAVREHRPLASAVQVRTHLPCVEHNNAACSRSSDRHNNTSDEAGNNDGGDACNVHAHDLSNDAHAYGVPAGHLPCKIAATRPVLSRISALLLSFS